MSKSDGVLGKECHPTRTEFVPETQQVLVYCDGVCGIADPIQVFDPISRQITHLIRTGACHKFAWTPPEGFELTTGLEGIA